ncbi:hypothetical protein Vretimale_14220 [Volvox reticuliferus]|uniref:Uncharacterized protein n=1 Tax=Volvox reticuliferus TaxID=1737510 RepID=A0A8J4CUS5_9CHLO|nr:hypothetical protein Vretifemale_15214 [Volvox reticuliferus]GIM10592.1 hypothetical protein Vretimale_14220 [Volvox reticuliferus]
MTSSPPSSANSTPAETDARRKAAAAWVGITHGSVSRRCELLQGADDSFHRCKVLGLRHKACGKSCAIQHKPSRLRQLNRECAVPYIITGPSWTMQSMSGRAACFINRAVEVGMDEVRPGLRSPVTSRGPGSYTEA